MQTLDIVYAEDNAHGVMQRHAASYYRVVRIFFFWKNAIILTDDMNPRGGRNFSTQVTMGAAASGVARIKKEGF